LAELLKMHEAEAIAAEVNSFAANVENQYFTLSFF
jgi:hypothetical protein